MAKRRGRGAPGLRAGLQGAAKLGRQMNRENVADWKVAVSASTAGAANLRNQLGRIDRVTRGNMRIDQTHLGNLSREARDVARATRGREAGTVRAYGSALGGSIREAFNPATERADASVVKQGALEAQGLQQQSIQHSVAQLAMAGAGAQESAAQYMLNQALMARNSISAETVAQLQGDLYKSAIDYNMQWSMWKRQQDYARKIAEKEAGPTGRNLVDRLVDEGADISVGAADAWRTHRDTAMEAGEDPNATANITQMATDWAAANGYAGDSDEVKVFIATMQQLKNSPDGEIDTGVAYANAIERLYSDAPGWNKWGPSLLEAGAHNIHTNLTDALAVYARDKNEVLDHTNASAEQPSPYGANGRMAGG